MRTNSPCPKVLLITDGLLKSEAYGIRRTLVNIFEKFPLLVVAPNEEASNREVTIGEHLYFKKNFTPETLNRLGKYAASFKTFFDLTILSRSNLNLSDSIAADIGVVSSNLISTYLAAEKLIKDTNIPYVVYLMDEIEELEKYRWACGSGDKLLKSLLEKSCGWMAVSKELIESVSKRLGIRPIRSLIVHNPVKTPNYRKILPRKTFRLGFAGSIWDMQKDPLVATANAISELRKGGKDIELVLHTPRYFWDKDEKLLWNPLEVKNGGELSYDQLHERLADECDLLLVTASFLKSFRSYSLSSLQTKVTDYMACGRPIFCVAPKDSAVAKFVNEWKCGFVQESAQVSDIADELVRLSSSQSTLIEAGVRGFEAAKTHFSTETVREKVESFLRDCL